MIFSRKTPGKAAPDKSRMPRHIAIIMDGNGRWAQKRGLPRTAGHSAGSDSFNRAVDYCALLGLEYLTVYAFSTENWSRPQDEVGAIMSLLDKNLRRSILEMREKNMGLYFWGDTEPLSQGLKALMRETDALSKELTGMRVNVCLNYGGRSELVRSTRMLAEKCVKGELLPEQIDEAQIEGTLGRPARRRPTWLFEPAGKSAFPTSFYGSRLTVNITFPMYYGPILTKPRSIRPYWTFRAEKGDMEAL